MANVGRRRKTMGISQYDPAAKGQPARNAGRQVGAKRALKPRRYGQSAPSSIAKEE
jgi:hypothetical protein